MSVMMTCGMYDAAGDWLTTVGIPAKSGVAGGIMGALPGQVGLAVFSPKIDTHGNSVRGVEIFERLSKDMGLHVMEGTPSAQTIVQSRYTCGLDHSVIVYELRGVLQFTESEMLLRILEAEPIANNHIVLDLTNISLIHDVGVRMLFEGVDLGGRRIIKKKKIDSEHLLEQSRSHAGHEVVVRVELSQYLQQFDG